MTEQWPVYVINLDRSPDRWDAMCDAFHGESLIRFTGVDGRQWGADGEFHVKQRPKFKPEAWDRLVSDGILHALADEFWPWIPGEVGCALSHINLWKEISKSDSSWTIVLEDDAEPTMVGGTLQGAVEEIFPPPEDADIVFLFGRDSHLEMAITDEDNRFLNGWSNLGYMITPRGAQAAVDASLPMLLPCDMQWWMRTFRGYVMQVPMPFPSLPKISAYAMPTAVVKHADSALKSTFTVDGSKPWKRSRY